MARKPNYNFERLVSESEQKPPRKPPDWKLKRKGEKKNTSNVELESNEPVPVAVSGSLQG